MKRYHLEQMLSSGTTCYHLGLHVIIQDAMLSSGTNVIICNKILLSGANVIMVSSGANVIIWCYHVMLSSGMITHPFFNFPEIFTHSTWSPNKLWRSTSIFNLGHTLSLTSIPRFSFEKLIELSKPHHLHYYQILQRHFDRVYLLRQ